MENRKNYNKFYICSLIALLIVSIYPIIMGIKAVSDMITQGYLLYYDYPKYLIPYVPIAVTVIFSVLIMPKVQKLSKKKDFLIISGISTVFFLVLERICETQILIQTEASAQSYIAESWQMTLCYVPPEEYRSRPWMAVNTLLGGYSQAFKIHFYLISIVIILSLLNWFYGKAKEIGTGDHSRHYALTIQFVTSIVFLGMCIWACFTSFYRDGELEVPVISSILMTIFFILLGVTMGVFVGSFTLSKKKLFSQVIPAITATGTTIIMYIGEMILLSKHLYRFGKGFFFQGLGELVLAPVDILVIIASGAATYGICALLNRKLKRKHYTSGEKETLSSTSTSDI